MQALGRVGEQIAMLVHLMPMSALGASCRLPDYADLHPQIGLGGGDRCEGSGIITPA